MLPLRHLRLWRIASVMLLVVVLTAALMPAVWFWDDKTAGLKWVSGIDKWMHGVTFAVLALWFTGLYARSSYWKIGIGLIVFGLAIEGCQRLVTYRTADLADVWSDLAGIVIGLLIGALGSGGWCLRAEKYLTESSN